MDDQDSSKQGSAPPPIDVNVSLALERSYLALERTMMAWIRTSLSLIGFGFTIAKFFEFMRAEKQVVVKGMLGNVWGPAAVGRILVGTGILALFFAVLQHRQALRSLHRHGLGMRRSLSLLIALILGLFGVIALIAMVLNL